LTTLTYMGLEEMFSNGKDTQKQQW
jgi:hypothetical protein